MLALAISFVAIVVASLIGGIIYTPDRWYVAPCLFGGAFLLLVVVVFILRFLFFIIKEYTVIVCVICLLALLVVFVINPLLGFVITFILFMIAAVLFFLSIDWTTYY